MDILYVFIVSCVIGSYMNVWIYRIPRKESVHFPGSHCTSCQTQLKMKDLIPIFSYLSLKGRCRYCGAKISPRYMLIEVLTGILVTLLYIHLGFNITWLMYAILTALMIALSLIDIDHMILPTKIIFFALVVGILGRTTQSLLSQNIMYFINACFTSLVVYIFMRFLYFITTVLFKGEQIGFGDVRYLSMLAFYTSLSSMAYIAYIIILLALFFCLIYKTVFKKKLTAFPFGPFISLGMYLGFFLF